MTIDRARRRNSVPVVVTAAARATGILLAASAVIFTALSTLPGDAVTVRSGGRVTPGELAEMRAAAGLDRPAPERYLVWLSDLVRGDPGSSLSTGREVTTMLSSRFTVSASIVAAALVVMIPLVAVLTVLLTRESSVRRTLGTGTSTILAALPQVVVAAGLAALLAGWASVVPPVSLIPRGSSPLAHPNLLLLPAATLAIPAAAYAALLVRGPIRDARRAGHVADARLRGVPPARIAVSYILPAVASPAVRIFAFVLAGLVSGTALVENVFGLSGLGELFVTAVADRDVPVVMAIAMLAAGIVVAGMLLADLIAARRRTTIGADGD